VLSLCRIGLSLCRSSVPRAIKSPALRRKPPVAHMVVSQNEQHYKIINQLQKKLITYETQPNPIQLSFVGNQ